MPSWRDDVFDDSDASPVENERFASFLAGYPNIAMFFAGEYDAQGKLTFPPGSISLWMEDGRLKCCWKIKAKGRVGFSVILDPVALIPELEKLLSQGLVEWRKEGVQKRR